MFDIFYIFVVFVYSAVDFVVNIEPNHCFGIIIANPTEYPSVVNIKYKDRFNCVGLIVNEKFILTAAHCINAPDTEPKPKYYTIITGTTNFNRGGERHKVAKTFWHSRYQYNPNGYSIHNIALLKLAQPLILNRFQAKADLAQAIPPDNKPAVVVGWAESDIPQDPDSLLLKKLDSTFLRHDLCSDKLRITPGSPPQTKLHPSTVCTLSDANPQGCYSISGSPVFVDNKAVGFFANPVGPLPNNEGYVSVFVRISYYRHSFIDRTIKANP